jgi:hypothetical protein
MYIFHAEKFQNCMQRVYPQGGEHNFKILTCRMHIVISIQRRQYGKAEKTGSFTVEKPDKYYLSQVTKINSNNGNMIV